MSVILGMNDDEYSEHPAIRSSLLKIAYEQTTWHALELGYTGSKAKNIGHAVHAMLEGAGDQVVTKPEEEDYPDAIRTVTQMKDVLRAAEIKGYSKWKRDELAEVVRDLGFDLWDDIKDQWEKDAEGKIILSKTEMHECKALYDATMEKMRRATTSDGVPLAILVERGHPEASVFAEDPDTGLELKVRPDRLIEFDEGWIVVSWKTVREGKASPREYAKEYRWRNYDLSDALYIDVIGLATGKPVLAIYNVVIEKVPEPSHHSVAVYETLPDHGVIYRGREKYREALDDIYNALESGEPEGWPDAAQMIGY